MAMKKFINDPNNLTPELLDGLCTAFADKLSLVSEKLVCRATPKGKDKVAILTLGGAGHEPALQGFVGEGMIDISAVGDIFAAPNGPKVFEAMKMLDGPAGILFVVLNHAGDVLNGNIAMTMAKEAGLNIRMILTHEDIAPGANAPIEDRRGLVGCVPLYKVAGAAAEAGKSLDEVFAIAERFNDNMATLAVAMTTATHPQNGAEIADLAEDEMEIGMGQHGEAGTGPCKIMTADDTAKAMVERLALAVGAASGDKVLLLVNGSGSTTHMEMFIIYRAARKVLEATGVEVACSMVGEYLTVQEMGGFQMFLAKMDDELIGLFNAPCDTPYWTVR